MIACLVIPGLELKAALRRTPSLALRPAALAPEPQGEPLLGPVTAAAEAAGVRPGMRLGEGLATCPSLALVEPDAAGAELAWEEILHALEDAGFAVDPASLGVVYFETQGVERLYGGLEPALRRALAAVGTAMGRAHRRGRTALRRARGSFCRAAGQVVVVADEELPQFLAPLPLTLLPLERRRYEELESLGVRKLGQLAGLPGGAVAERLGPDGRRAWGLARGGAAARVRGRRHPPLLAASLEFPEAVGNELTLRRALAGARRRRPRTARAARPVRPQGRARRPARERRLVAADADPARAERRSRPHPRRALATARRAAGSGRRASPRARRADRADRPPARAARRRRGGSLPPAGRAAPGAGEHRLRLRLHRRGGRALVRVPESARAARAEGRVAARFSARPARVEATRRRPSRSTTSAVALVREEWRVVDRWWTEEPIVRRYFELVLESGENTVVFHDGASGGWFTQRGA